MFGRKSVFLLGVLGVLLLFCLTGCGKNESIAESPSVNTEKTQEPKDEKREISIYTINDDTLESEPVTVELEGELTAENVVFAAVKALEEHSLEIGIYSITTEEDTVIVSFQKDTAPLTGVGAGVEETILNCISDSLIDNIEGCKNVIFRCADGPYKSGHIEFELDEVYVSE
jgi:hypothetical protein